MKRVRTRVTYANVMANIAVFIALGGSSYAALTVSGKNVKNSSLTGKDVKNSSLTSSDVKNRTLLSRDFKSGQLPAGAQGAAGAPGAPGAPGSAVAYARVEANGTLDASRSKNVAANRITTGYYCVNPTVPVKHVVASVDLSPGEINPGFTDPFTSCPAGTVQTYNSSGAFADRAFFVAFN